MDTTTFVAEFSLDIKELTVRKTTAAKVYSAAAIPATNQLPQAGTKPDGWCHVCFNNKDKAGKSAPRYTPGHTTRTCPTCAEIRTARSTLKKHPPWNPPYDRANSENRGDRTCNDKRPRDNREPRPCRFFTSDRGCRAGSKCKFAHLGKPTDAGVKPRHQVNKVQRLNADAETMKRYLTESTKMGVELGKPISNAFLKKIKKKAMQARACPLLAKMKQKATCTYRWATTRFIRTRTTHTHVVTVGRAQVNSSSPSGKFRANEVTPTSSALKQNITFLNDGGASQTCVPSIAFITNAKALDATHTIADAQLKVSRATHEGDLALHVITKKNESTVLQFAKVWVVPSCPEPILAQRLVRELGLRYIGPPGNGSGFHQDDKGNAIPLTLDEHGLETLSTSVTTTQKMTTGAMHAPTHNTVAMSSDTVAFEHPQHRSALSKQMTEKECKQLFSQTDPEALMHDFISMTDYRGSRRCLTACRLAEENRYLMSTDAFNQLQFLHHVMMHPSLTRVARTCKLGNIVFRNQGSQL